MPSNWYINLAFMENDEQYKCLDYESEATGNYVQVWSASRCLLLGENPSQKIIIICFSYSKCLIEILIHIFGRGRREMEESLRAQRLRGTQNHVHWRPKHPPWGDLEGPVAESVQRAQNS